MANCNNDDDPFFDDEILDYLIFEDINKHNKPEPNPRGGGCLSLFIAIALFLLLPLAGERP
jgi:hypothetical protein